MTERARSFALAASLGFDTVVIEAPFARADGAGERLVVDWQLSAPELGGGDAAELIATIAAECREHGLAPYLDLSMDRVAAANADVRARGELFSLCAPPGADPPDPRRPEATLIAANARFDDDAAASSLIDIWNARLAEWIDAGVAGFRCLSLENVPGAVWSALIASARARAPDIGFAAWTPGLAAEEIAALAECGFDRVFSSLPWWNFSDGWWLDEAERLGRVASIVAPLEDPLGARLAVRCDDIEAYRRAARRLIDFAAATADGILVVDGFERGPQGTERLDGLADDVTRATRALHDRTNGARRMRDLLGGGAPLIAWLSEETGAADGARLVLANPCLDRVVSSTTESILRAAGTAARFVPVAGGDEIGNSGELVLRPGEIRVLAAEHATPVRLRAEPPAAAAAAARADRVAIENPTPCVDGGRFAVKRTIGDTVRVEVDAFSEGHDALAVELLWRAADAKEWSRTRMRALGNDRWAGEFPLDRLGRHVYRARAWVDVFASERHNVEAKFQAQALTDVDVEDACRLVREAAASARGAAREPLAAISARIDAAGREERIARLLSAELSAAMAALPPTTIVSESAELPIECERLGARYASWYELFPRSLGRDSATHGTFDDVIARLPAIRDMGFDVLYMPPIHPIGTTHRKGRNNARTAEPDDPGSPYAIGSPDGGHDAIHPELGGFAAFERLREAAHAMGIEIALDFAIQCSPDHPWLAAHPEWFDWRSDGSVRHAENPPKKYEDIVNVDFYAKDAVPSLWLALRDIVLFWAERGVRLFRVDNPHTKPFPFWEWLIGDVRTRHPDVVFLSEAFTRPKRMYRLAKLGFSQSYTYFTWRDGKRELTDYFRELADGPPRDFFRPHLFVNTPDINPLFLQRSGRAGFLIRAALAATLGGLWGVYSGFELCESAALPGKEEYLDSEKYELRPRDWNAPGNIVAEITMLNRIRRMNPALQDHLGLTFYNAFNDQILYFGKATPDRDNAILVAVNLDPHAAQEAEFELPLWEWQLPDHGAMVVEDLVRGGSTVWRGKMQHVRLDPSLPFAIWRIRPERAS